MQSSEFDYMAKETVILVNIEPLRDWYAASSEDLKGFFMTFPSLPELIDDIPQVIKMFYKHQMGLNVNVRAGSGGDNKNIFPLRFITTQEAA